MCCFEVVNVSTTVRKVSASLILTVLVCLLLNSIIYPHAHRLHDGQVITHAHPHQSNPENESPFENHSHSEGEFWLLDLIYHAVYEAGDNVTLHKPVLPEHCIEFRCTQVAQCTSAPLSYVLSFRGPPVM